MNTLTGCSWLQYVMTHSERGSARLAAQAESAEEQGNSKLAVMLYDEATTVSPDNTDYLRRCAKCLVKSHQYDEAITRLRRINEIDPTQVDGHLELAKLLIQSERYIEAETVLDKALAIDAKNIESLMLKGELVETTQQYELATQLYYRVLNENPEHIDARLKISNLEIAAARPERATPLLRGIGRSNELSDEKRGQVYWLLGIAYGQQKQWADAAQTLQQAMKWRTETTADDWYRVAYAFHKSGDDVESQKAVTEALQHDSTHGQSQALRASLVGSENALASQPITQVGHSVAMLSVPVGW